MAYRAAPPDSSVIVACSPLVAWRGIAAAVVPVLAAAVVYAAAGLGGVALWAPFLAFTALLLRASVLGSAGVTLRVDARRRRVSVRTGRLLGRSIEREVDLSDAQAIAVETRRSDHWLRHLPWGPLLEGRILMRDGRGDTHALCEPRFNPRAQAKAAARLAALLDVARDPVAGVDVPLPPAPVAAFPNSRVYVWFGSSVVLVSLIGFGAQMIATRDQGRFVLECTTTCRFEGMTCLPGGAIEGSYSPGELLVEVVDRAAPGGYRAVVVPIRVGHRTTFECLPDARPPIPSPE